MNAIPLKKIVEKRKKRIGRGHGSGKVKTSGRGQKGQNARGTMRPGFEGGQLALIKRLPLLRGKGRNGSMKNVVTVIRISDLDPVPAGTSVTLATLKKYTIITEQVVRVKLLAGGELKKKLTIEIPCSRSARETVEKAGGTVLA